MPPARSAATARSARVADDRAPRPRRVPSKRPIARIRWDRVGRLGLLVVLAIVAGLYVQHALELLATHAQASRQLSIVNTLATQNAVLERERTSLSDPAVIQRDARALGMVRAGERPYVITGQPGH
jgi:cell division protein FtsB